MSYQVLARKWRPRNFAELVGQAHVVKVLANSLAEGRVHHAFLFTGTRGVGKTTIARILAKSLNCLEGVSAEPCGVCEHCVAIDEGRFVDLLEIDAASRTRVDDTREILDNVQYAPAQGRYKVYLIDEVHMLSTHSFNALLKTLEEPPDHVKFVLATTDPQKIPVTILSRCLQFNLRRLSPDEIGLQMTRILEAEGLDFEPEALTLLARAADGSMRDGLSLLDQALAGGSHLLEAEVRDMLGSVERRHVHDLVEALADQDAGRAMAVVAEVFAQARDLGQLLLELAETLHRIALIQNLPDYRDDTRSDWETLLGLAGRFDPEDLQLYYQIAITGRRDLELAPNARTGCEMTILRMLAFRPVDTQSGKQAGAPEGSKREGAAAQGGPGADSQARLPRQASRPDEDSARRSVTAPVAGQPQVAEAPVSGTTWRPDRKLGPDNWAEVIERMNATGSARMVAGLLVLEAVDEPNLRCRAAADDMMMVTDSIRDSLERSLTDYLGGPVKLSVRAASDQDLNTPARQAQDLAESSQREAEAAIDDDPVVRKLCDRFGAEVLRESIRPNQTRSH
ncbi:MAG: DNA polymerase III subunit gamma/tau [Wenzhouxiangella sp.]|nr:MAG: DNA polymerase III subunit gamma/tau [Wenzhouxiangella sp.]